MNNFIAAIYAQFVNKGRLKKEDVPEGVDIDNTPNVTATPEPEVHIKASKEEVALGALYIPPMHDREIDIITLIPGSYFDTLMSADIFTEGFLYDHPMPENIEYRIKRVEPNSFVFSGKPEITISEIEGGFKLKFNGNVKINVLPNTSLFRVDVEIESSNYEDMLLSIYYVAK